MATVTATTEPLHKEAQRYLALSIMAYLYSDLRSLSATGFTSFPFASMALMKSDNEGRCVCERASASDVREFHNMSISLVLFLPFSLSYRSAKVAFLEKSL
jgi:hypothetical protein